MQDRIEINGVWYIREDLSNNQKENIEVTYSMSCQYEDDDYFWEATRLLKEDGITYYPDIDIKFTDKRTKPWKEDHWDSNPWMISVMNNDPEALKDARECMCPSGVKTFQLFLNKLKEEGWLK